MRYQWQICKINLKNNCLLFLLLLPSVSPPFLPTPLLPNRPPPSSRRGRQCRAARGPSAPPPLAERRHGCTGCTRKRVFPSRPTFRSTTSSMEAGAPNLLCSNFLHCLLPPISTSTLPPSRCHLFPRSLSPSSSSSSSRRRRNATPRGQTLALAIPRSPSRSCRSLP
jgi:hypothetical protein